MDEQHALVGNAHVVGHVVNRLRIGAEFGPFARAQVDEDHRHFRVAFVVGRGVVSAHDVAVGRDGRRMEVVELTVYYRQGSVAQLCDLDACRGLACRDGHFRTPFRSGQVLFGGENECRSLSFCL